jgi:Xaa-Pro aminopeptidase
VPVAAAALDLPILRPSPGMFRAHREKFLAKLPPNSIAILRAAPMRIMSNDVEYLYRQDSDFWYLTGIEAPDAIAVLRPNAEDGKRYIVFVPPRDRRRESYEGPKVGPAEAVEAYGADAAFSTGEFADQLSKYDPPTRTYSGFLAGLEKIYVSDGSDSAWGESLRERIADMRSREAGPSTFVDARELIHELRVVKDADEIGLIRRATEISGRGHVLAMRAAAPGLYEFEVQAVLDGYCYANGVRRMAYPSIVASGPNSVFLHWDRNDRLLQDGDVVLNDSGAEYAYYATDVTRTYPAGGKFSTEQRAIYDVVLAAQKAAMAQIRPGIAFDRPGAAATRVLTEGLVKLGLMSGSVEKIVKESGHRVFTKHGVSHWVGLDVHDVGSYNAGAASRPLEPGMVFTVEPGIYVAADPGVDRKWWNIGIRIEDMVLVTDTGFECLSCFVPREAVEVERTVQSGRPADIPRP